MQLFRRIPIRITITLLFIIFIATYVGGYFFLSNSDVFAKAVEYVKSDQSLSSRIGTVKEVKMAHWQPQSVTSTDLDGEAKFVIDIESDKGSYRYRVYLHKENKKWKVVSVSPIDK